MIKKNTLADLGTRVDFNPGQPPRKVGNESPQPLEPTVPAPMGPPMQDEGMQTGVTGQHLPSRARSRIAVKNALNIGAKAFEHAQSLAPMGITPT
jgi:hypothetical protein